jgi:flagellin
MNTQVRGMTVAMRNANDGISMAQVGEGALGKVSDIFQRMRELAVQSANGTNSTADRASLNQEFVQLAQEATRTLGGTQFNGQNILATAGNSVFQIGANNTANIDQISVQGFDWTANTDITQVLGNAVLSGTDTGSYDAATSVFTAGADIPTAALDTAAGAQAAIANIDYAIGAVNTQRANFGAVQNRFDNVVATLQVSTENQSAARSRIMDADYAVETSNLSRANILQQAGNAMVAQANQMPQQVLSLLK